jgi:hypothetical protein
MKFFIMFSAVLGILISTKNGYANQTLPNHIVVIPHMPLILEPVRDRDWQYPGSQFNNPATQFWLSPPNTFTVPAVP